ncbi:MAG: hypothetical protein MO852_07030 [Candidatus Devosia euplotis]|nr:hypothetical protein [Candidatus Devosia euplotis]
MLLDIDIGVSTYFEKLSDEAKAADAAAKAKIIRAVDLTGEALKSLTEGDLTKRITADLEPEFDQIKQDANAVAERLTAIMGQLRKTLRGVRSTTGEILAGANDLADRTTRQAATIEQTAATVEQLTATVVENASMAGVAGDKAQAVSKNATTGGNVMNEANDAMGAIGASSDKISNIIGLIGRYRFPGQLVGPQCLDRGRAGRRCKQGLCRGGRGSASSRPVSRQCLCRGQAAD